MANVRAIRNLMVFWAYLEPCDLNHQPGKRIKDFQAMTLDGNLKPMSSMTDWQWKATMVNGCQMIDSDFVKPWEKPVVTVHPIAGRSDGIGVPAR
jgi:hypothetical protein